jgi:phytoene synthase
VSARTDLDTAGITDPALRASYQRCRALNARHGRTYYLATLLLPPAKRPYVHALYGFARYADDIVDEPATPAGRAERFTRWADDFRTDLDWGTTSDPVTRAVLDTIARWQLPHEYFHDFLQSMTTDLTVTEYETFADLQRYMWGSAAVIGLELLPILGRRDAGVEWHELEPPAIALGTAFQLTNFLRDVEEDLRRGRIYLPQESLRQFEVDRDRLARRRVDEPIRNLLAWEIERARGFYRTAQLGLPLVAPDSQPCLRTALMLYEGILDEIEEADYDVFSGRVSVPMSRRAVTGLSGARAAWRARQPDRSTPPAAEPAGDPATPTGSALSVPARIRTTGLRLARTRFGRR